jgi:hypothetical protein
MSTASQATCDWQWNAERQNLLCQVGRRPMPKLRTIRRHKAVQWASWLGPL